MSPHLSTPPTIAAGSLAAHPQPIIAAQGGLILRPWEASDAAAFFTAYQDPAVQHWHTRQPASEAQVKDWFEQYRHNWEQEKGASWAVTRDGHKVVGRVALGNIDLDAGIAGCAYWVLPAARSPQPAAPA